MILARLIDIVRLTRAAFLRHRAQQMAASLAFYALLSLAPVLIFATAIAGAMMGPDVTVNAVGDSVNEMAGPSVAKFITGMVSTSGSRTGAVATLIGVATLLWSASRLFDELQNALNVIWNVPPPDRTGLRHIVRRRVLAFTMVLATGFVLLVLLLSDGVASAVAGAVGDATAGRLAPTVALLDRLDAPVGVVVLTVAVALVFRTVPAGRIAWRDALIGAAVTSVLVALGNFGVGLYIRYAGLASAYGAAGAPVAILLWAHYVAQMLLIGAEFTQVYAYAYGSLRGTGPAHTGVGP